MIIVASLKSNVKKYLHFLKKYDCSKITLLLANKIEIFG
jgi:hypothetical protein